jgi:rod shape-determining protein MreC
MDFDNSNSDSNFVYKSATIISWTASNFSSSFTINKGTSSGVDVDDCVITENGYLVGVVTEAGKSSSTVVSIIDTTMSIGAMLYSNSETGVIEGNFELFKQGKLKLSYINNNANVVIGDSVVTSGRGGIYPSGLVIGYVDSIGENPSGLDYYAVVSPAADFDSITHLYVITDFDAD